jgi:ubiquinone/menaquinone biosynthesis C-methylase UbiE
MSTRVNYDDVAEVYDRRYENNHYASIRAILDRFIGADRDLACCEAGCGTGHWLAHLHGRPRTLVGFDASAEMLKRARTAAPGAHVVRARTEHLPVRPAVFDRIFCINAMHHFQDVDAFLRASRRILKPQGGLLIVGLDPHTGLDRWWVYDCFPSARERDRKRYLATADIRQRLAAAGFTAATTEVAEEFRLEIPFHTALARGLLDRRTTSQLMMLDAREYQEGLDRLRATTPLLRADLRLYATQAWVGGPGPDA